MKFLKRIANAFHKDVTDFMPIMSGSLIVNEPKPVPTRTYTPPWSRTKCVVDSQNPCSQYDCCQDDNRYLGYC